MSIYIFFTLLIATFLPIANAQDPDCYSIAGVQVDGLFSCDPSAANSACCSPGDICYSNGLCAPSQESIDAGAETITPFFWDGCTDPTFEDSSCFAECHSVPGNGVQVCQAQGVGEYCCYGFGGCDCTNSSQVFSIAAGAKVITTLALSMTHSTSSASPTSSTQSTTSTTSSSSSSTATASSTLSSTSASTPTSSPTNTAAAKDTNKNSSSVPLGVGIGLGVPGFLALVGLAFFLWRRALKKKINRVEMPANDMRGAYKRPIYQSPASPFPLKATEVQQKYYISEMDGAGTPAEMPGNESRR